MPFRKSSEPIRPKRTSRLVARRAIPASIRLRFEVEKLLGDRDFSLVKQPVINDAHLSVVRRIAFDQSTEGEGFALRRRAVAAIGLLGTTEDLNLMEDLARFDNDPGIRAEALLGLGRSGLALVTPVLVAAIASNDPLEAAAGSKALEILVAKVGDSVVRMRIEKSATRERRIAMAVLDRFAATARARSRNALITLPDPPGLGRIVVVGNEH
jgi:hypothetical protein